MYQARCKDIWQKTVHRKESRGCGNLFIWFGGPLDKRFQGPFMCCLLLPQTLGCIWLLQWSNPVSIGSHSDQTSFQSSSLYLWTLGKDCFVQMSSSTLCCTVFLYNVFGPNVAVRRSSQERPWEIGLRRTIATAATAVWQEMHSGRCSSYGSPAAICIHWPGGNENLGAVSHAGKFGWMEGEIPVKDLPSIPPPPPPPVPRVRIRFYFSPLAVMKVQKLFRH
jgi:hypothetical protein